MSLTARESMAAATSRRAARLVAPPLAAILFTVGFAQYAWADDPDGAADQGAEEIASAQPAADEALSEQAAEPDFVRDLGTGIASYYADRFAGRSTASGQAYDPVKLTAAHRSLPFGSRVLVTSMETGQSVVVTINDRGPFRTGRIIDLSREAASRIGLVRQGHGAVNLALLAD